MNKMFSRAEILEGVRRDVADCVGHDIEEVESTSTFFTDLDGESIDVIDLMFRCEKRFGVRVELQGLLSQLQLGPDGRLTAESVRYIQERVPEIDWNARVAAISSNDPRDILTVDLICELFRLEICSATRASDAGEILS